MNQLQIIGHRGARGLAPENSLTGIKEALRHKPDWIEIDVRVSKDNVPFIVHDPSLGRVTDDWRFVSQLTAKELSTLPLRHGEPLITLQQALDAILPHSKVLVEVKSRAAAIPTALLIQQHVLKGIPQDHFIVQSFWPHILKRVHAVAPNIKLGLLQHAIPVRFSTVSVPLFGVGFYHRVLPRHALQLAKKRGLWVYAHTVDNVTEAKKLASWGVDAIVTNRPDLFTS